MKKALSFILCLCLVLALVGCAIVSEADAESDEKDLSSRIEQVHYDSKIRIYVDTETKVMYLFVKSGYGGGLTVMLDENGNPLLWDESEVRE